MWFHINIIFFRASRQCIRSFEFSSGTCINVKSNRRTPCIHLFITVFGWSSGSFSMPLMYFASTSTIRFLAPTIYICKNASGLRTTCTVLILVGSRWLLFWRSEVTYSGMADACLIHQAVTISYPLPCS